MIISFFEEFPTAVNLEKLSEWKAPTKLYLAAPSFQKFCQISRPLRRRKQVREIVYWPILDKKEGYWISPFSSRKALQRVLGELEGQHCPVMLDLELPTSQNPRLYLTQAGNFRKNKSFISSFLRHHEGPLYLAEYYPEGRRPQRMLEFLGLHYPLPQVKIIKMLYHSLHPFTKEFLENQLLQGKQQWGKQFIPALGVLAPGIPGNEPRITPQELEKELQLASAGGISEVILFRLGGLTLPFLSSLQKTR